MTMPKVTVILPAYNHADYVGKAIESVLCQKDVTFELLIIDDGSKDNTPDIIKKYRDPRIRVLPNYGNRGACIATNDLIQNARGQYIALINSDDYWEGDDKLFMQVAFLDENLNVGACFGKAKFVDKHGIHIPHSDLPFGHVFEQHNRSKGQWLRFFFESGNCICHPTMLIRRQCYDDVGMYRNIFRQLPDYDMWIRLVKRWDIHIFDKVLINFRIMPGENASSPTSKNAIRTLNEHYLIACEYFDNVTDQDLADGFSDIFYNPRGLCDPLSIEIEKVILLFADNRWLGRAYAMAALPKLSRLLSSPSHRAYLKNNFSIDEHWFHNKMSEVDVLLPNVVAELQIKKNKLRNMLRFFMR